MLKLKTLILTAFFLLALLACKKNKRAPLITTSNVSEISFSSVVCGGVLYAEGDSPVTEKGLCWSVGRDPTIDDNKVIAGSGAGSFSAKATGLQPLQNYYIRTYATNKYGTSYGRSYPFTTTDSRPAQIITIGVALVKVNAATVGGSVTAVTPIIESGVCYGTSPNPTTNNFKALASNEGLFSCILTGLMANTTYYARPYVTDQTGTIYSSQLTFKTYYGTVTDIDGNEYMTTKIGNQEWMAENLKTMHFNNGSPIPEVDNNYNYWHNTQMEAYCYYDDEYFLLDTYGLLYNWHAVAASGLAPVGWHVPTQSEWNTLIASCTTGGSALADNLKEQGTTHWNYGGNNMFNFTALPGGVRDEAFDFAYLGQQAYFWSRTNDTPTTAIGFNVNAPMPYSYSQSNGMSVRCVRD